jgi:hypothetical protein
MLAICEVESLCDEINVLDNSMRPRHWRFGPHNFEVGIPPNSFSAYTTIVTVLRINLNGKRINICYFLFHFQN